MTSVTQKIRRFTGGISDQPDEQKLPGQVRDATNATPDVVYGLLKRPGTNLIPWSDDVTDEGKWFWINKRNPATGEERYVGQISLTSGKVRIWNLFDGKEQTIKYKDKVDPTELDFAGFVARNNNSPDLDNEPYFTIGHTPGKINVDDLQVLTVNDVTYVTNRKVSVSMSANCGEKRQPEGFYELRTLAGATEYNLRLFDIGKATNIVTSVGIVEVNGREGFSELAPEVIFKDEPDDKTKPSGLEFKIVTSVYTDPNGVSYYSDEVCLLNPGQPAEEAVDGVFAEYKLGDKFKVTANTLASPPLEFTVEILSLGDANERSEDPIIDAKFALRALREVLRAK